MEKINGQSARYNQIVQLRKKTRGANREGEHNGMVMFIYIVNFIAKIEIIKINNELAGASTVIS
ncbi:hypothetical protein QT346_24025 [Escherichia coli]|nr:hypothetical protein [Escherichia coli]